jgi:hypothetical protein
MGAGVLCVVLVGGMATSPLSPALAPGTGPYPPLSTIVRALGLDALTDAGRAAASIVAVLFVTAGFLFALRSAWNGAMSVRLVTGLGIVFVVVATALPLLLSRDVYSYTMYGRIASLHQANPYVAVPADFANDSIYPLVGPEWRRTPAVYGPAFTLVSAGITRVFRSTVADVWAFKSLAGGAGIALILMVAAAARRLAPRRAAFAVALVAWNPVFLFDAVGSGHNDVLVGCALAGALLILAGPLSRGATEGSRRLDPSLAREVAAAGVLTVGALVKAPAAIALVLLVVASLWRRGHERIRGAAAHGAVVVGVVAVFAAPFFQTDDPTLGLATLATHLGWLAPTRLFRVLLGDAATSLFGTSAGEAVQIAVRVAFATVFAIVYVLLIRRTGQVAARRVRPYPAGASGTLALGEWATVHGGLWAWGLLLFMLLSPVLLPWYAVWVLPVAWVMPREGLVGAVAVSGVLAVSQTIAEPLNLNYPAVYDGMVLTGHYVLTPALCLVLGWLLVSFGRRIRGGTPLDDGSGATLAASPTKVRGGIAPQGDGHRHGEHGAAGEGGAQAIGGHARQQERGGAEGGSERQASHEVSGRRQRPAQPHCGKEQE